MIFESLSFVISFYLFCYFFYSFASRSSSMTPCFCVQRSLRGINCYEKVETTIFKIENRILNQLLGTRKITNSKLLCGVNDLKNALPLKIASYVFFTSIFLTFNKQG